MLRGDVKILGCHSSFAVCMSTISEIICHVHGDVIYCNQVILYMYVILFNEYIDTYIIIEKYDIMRQL